MRIGNAWRLLAYSESVLIPGMESDVLSKVVLGSPPPFMCLSGSANSARVGDCGLFIACRYYSSLLKNASLAQFALPKAAKSRAFFQRNMIFQ